MRYGFNNTDFADCVKQFVGKRKLRDAGEEAGISASALCRIINGKSPNIRTFGQLCGMMRREPREFFFDEEYSGDEG